MRWTTLYTKDVKNILKKCLIYGVKSMVLGDVKCCQRRRGRGGGRAARPHAEDDGGAGAEANAAARAGGSAISIV